MTILHRGTLTISPNKQILIREYVHDGTDGSRLDLEAIDQAMITLQVRRAEILESIHPPPTSDQPVAVPAP